MSNIPNFDYLLVMPSGNVRGLYYSRSRWSRNPPGKNVITGEAGYYPDGSEWGTFEFHEFKHGDPSYGG